MPIIGKITAFPDEFCIKNMDLQQKAYLNTDDIFFTRKALFIDIYSPLSPFEEFDGIPGYVLVVRIGPGLTQDDFEVYFTLDDNSSEGIATSFTLAPESVYHRCMEGSSMYLIFTDFIIDDGSEPVEVLSPEEEIEKLLKKQAQLVNEDNTEAYAEAAQIAKQIEELQRKIGKR